MDAFDLGIHGGQLELYVTQSERDDYLLGRELSGLIIPHKIRLYFAETIKDKNALVNDLRETYRPFIKKLRELYSSERSDYFKEKLEPIREDFRKKTIRLFGSF